MSRRDKRDELKGDALDLFGSSDVSALSTNLPIADIDNVGFGGLNLPVVHEADGNVRIGKGFIITSTGLLVESITETEYWAFFEGIRRIESAVQWIIGDLVIYGVDVLNQNYDTIAERTGYDRETVKNFAYAARNIPAEIRHPELSWNHHLLLAPQDIADKSAWLSFAHDNSLSKRDLHAAIEIWRNGGNPETILSQAVDKPSAIQKAMLKGEKDRLSIQKRAKGKQRQQWLSFVEQEAQKWQELLASLRSDAE